MIDNDNLRAQLLDMLGLDAVTSGDLVRGRTHYVAAAEIHLLLLDYEGSAYCLSGLAGLALALNRADASARLGGAAIHAREVVGAGVWPAMEPLEATRNAAVADALDPAALAEATAAGAGLRLADALSYGLTATHMDPQQQRSKTEPA